MHPSGDIYAADIGRMKCSSWFTMPMIRRFAESLDSFPARRARNLQEHLSFLPLRLPVRPIAGLAGEMLAMPTRGS
jgi:hypothetical protein